MKFIFFFYMELARLKEEVERKKKKKNPKEIREIGIFD